MSGRADRAWTVLAGAALLALVAGLGLAAAGWRWGIFMAASAFCVLWLVAVTGERRWNSRGKR